MFHNIEEEFMERGFLHELQVSLCFIFSVLESGVADWKKSEVVMEEIKRIAWVPLNKVVNVLHHPIYSQQNEHANAE